MQNTDYDNRVRERPVIDSVAIVERDAQADCELFPLGTRKWKMPHRLKGRFKSCNEAGCDLFGRFGCKVGPDFRKVLFGRLGETKG
jgi:hypothetical protein